MDVLVLLAACLAGVGIGILSGLLGIGGGTVMVPIFKLGFGMTAIGATATSLFAIIPTAISGGITHVRQKTCIPKLGVLAGIGGACLSPAGVWLASISPGWLIMLAAAIVIGYSAVTMFKKGLAVPRKPGSSYGKGVRPGDAPEGEESALHQAERRAEGPGSEDLSPSRRVNYWLGLPIGALAGLVAGYVGVGGGFLMVPLFLSVLKLDMKRASGSSLVAIGILATPGAIMQIVLGNVAVLVACAVLLGSVPGAVLGARLAKRMPERQLRLAFGVVLMVAAVLLVLQEIGLF